MSIPPPVARTPSWQTLAGSDLYSTGASGPAAVRPVQAPNPVESMDRLGGGAIVKTPDKPSAPVTPNRDWTEAPKQASVKAPDAPPKPQAVEQFVGLMREMWRTSGSAMELAQEINKMALAERMSLQAKNDEPLTYTDPSIKRPGRP